VLGLDNHGHPSGLKCFKDGVSNLLGHPFLKLRAPGADFYHPGQLAYPYHSTTRARDITDMSYAIKWQEMVFTHGIEGNVL
jgi:hypothetical protein